MSIYLDDLFYEKVTFYCGNIFSFCQKKFIIYIEMWHISFQQCQHFNSRFRKFPPSTNTINTYFELDIGIWGLTNSFYDRLYAWFIYTYINPIYLLRSSIWCMFLSGSLIVVHLRRLGAAAENKHKSNTLLSSAVATGMWRL